MVCGDMLMTAYFGKNKSNVIIYHNFWKKFTKSQVLSLDILSIPSRACTAYSPNVCDIGLIASHVNTTSPMRIVAGGVAFYLAIRLTLKDSFFAKPNKCTIFLHNAMLFLKSMNIRLNIFTLCICCVCTSVTTAVLLAGKYYDIPFPQFVRYGDINHFFYR